ncbi:MAG: hypothetical protein RI897_3824, partial [Verrucomicrobiota bacterium]
PGVDWGLGDELTFVFVSRGGDTWLGTEEGLAVWNGRQGLFVGVEAYAFGGALSMVDAGGGKLWCATGRGVVEGDGRVWSFMRPTPGDVERLRVLRDGSLWAMGEGFLKRFWAGAWVEQLCGGGVDGLSATDVWLDTRGGLWLSAGGRLWLQHPEVDTDAPRTEVISAGGRRTFSTRERVSFLVRGMDRWKYVESGRLLFSTRLNEGAWTGYESGSVLWLTNLTAGAQRLEVRSMDLGLNEEVEPAVFEFVAFVPWYAEPRIVIVAGVGVLVAMVLAALAVNRHFRLLRSYAEVERIVEERTRELERANEELVHSHKMRALGTLAAGIAHDFNAILSIIKGSAQIIESSLGDPEKIKVRVDRIRKMVDQGAGIVRTMLGLSRTSRQDWRVIRMESFLEETIRLVSEQLPVGVHLHLEAAPDVPEVRIASDLFRQMLINLILNAGEAMSGEGEILLRAWAGQVGGGLVLPPSRKGGAVVVEVLDTGIGIAPDVLPRIFEPFFTTKAFSTRKGTGLGLTMVHEIARELGLGLGVESVPGQGTVFRICIPEGLGR